MQNVQICSNLQTSTGQSTCL